MGSVAVALEARARRRTKLRHRQRELRNKPLAVGTIETPVCRESLRIAFLQLVDIHARHVRQAMADAACSHRAVPEYVADFLRDLVPRLIIEGVTVEHDLLHVVRDLAGLT